MIQKKERSPPPLLSVLHGPGGVDVHALEYDDQDADADDNGDSDHNVVHHRVARVRLNRLLHQGSADDRADRVVLDAVGRHLDALARGVILERHRLVRGGVVGLGRPKPRRHLAVTLADHVDADEEDLLEDLKCARPTHLARVQTTSGQVVAPVHNLQGVGAGEGGGNKTTSLLFKTISWR